MRQFLFFNYILLFCTTCSRSAVRAQGSAPTVGQLGFFLVQMPKKAPACFKRAGNAVVACTRHVYFFGVICIRPHRVVAARLHRKSAWRPRAWSEVLLPHAARLVHSSARSQAWRAWRSHTRQHTVCRGGSNRGSDTGAGAGPAVNAATVTTTSATAIAAARSFPRRESGGGRWGGECNGAMDASVLWG